MLICKNFIDKVYFLNNNKIVIILIILLLFFIFRGITEVSKKESEFDRYDRMKKLQKEAELHKKKSFGEEKRKGKPKASYGASGKHRLKSYILDDEDDYYEYYN